jgi:mannose-6-phosphate isomerase-like protein (cupin superfamily)
MALKPKEEIGMELHKLDQFFRVEEGTGEAVLDGVRTVISAGFAGLVPAGTNRLRAVLGKSKGLARWLLRTGMIGEEKRPVEIDSTRQ